jgi:hypothetical protein
VTRGDHYTEDFKPTYRIRDESYGGRPRFLVERVVPSGGMSWGFTSYTTREAAQKVVDALTELVLDEVP